MMRFGPAGNSDRFYEEGHKRSAEAPAWLASRGLSAYEYSFGRGISLGEETARLIGEEASKYDISVSGHAPYYINLADPDKEKRAKSITYILESARRVYWMGGHRLVVHVGAQQNRSREAALENCIEGLAQAIYALDCEGLGGIHICPETMGKAAQIGDLEEILAFCKTDERLIPCIDFAHLHALGDGALNTENDFQNVLDKAESALGKSRARQMHIHFSAIEYTNRGEKRHKTFVGSEYGPKFCNLAPLLAERDYEATIICECSGTQAEDAAEMKHILDSFTGDSNAVHSFLRNTQ